MAEGKNRELTFAVSLAIVVALAVFGYELILRTMHEEDVWIAAAYGFFAAQTILIAIWAVFAPVNLVLRLSCWLFFGLLTWYVVVFALLETNEGWHSKQLENAPVFGLFVLSVVTLHQIPLWIAKRTLRFRMIWPGELPNSVASERLQFQLKDLLLATFILAIALSPIRLVLPYCGFDKIRLFPARYIVITAVILVATLPSLWASFVARPGFVPASRLALYVSFVTGIEVR